ncbi:hypothetical protein AWZ03_012966 [Drosophila navojoa]|uniref:Uncharacterized protein n=1 Tax=Drosophila navojoa TaxID=7232 RepID=A0A484AX86_DRONA|nr:uncharacterized protein LOC115564660 [Drosophila navojoa]TDG40612.1 hypothetical protein AWZ03_012966 [Drosophila navojoa]
MFNNRNQDQQAANQQELDNLVDYSSGASSELEDVHINIMSNDDGIFVHTTPNNSENLSGVSVNGSAVPPSESTIVFKQLFATLEAEHQKLRGLEQRRIKLTEEMRNLRDMLQKENRRLRSQSQQPFTHSDSTPTTSSSARKSHQSKSARNLPRDVAGSCFSRGVTILEHNKANDSLVSVSLPFGLEEQKPRPQVGEVVIEMIDPNPQPQTTESSSLWHTPVTSVDMETFLQMSNTTVAQSSTQTSKSDKSSRRAD